MNKFFYNLYKIILGPIFKICYHPTVIGNENILKEGPIIVAGDHIHLYDQCLTILYTKRYLKYMAKKEYFDNKLVAWFFKSVGCIPVDRSKKDPNASNLALEHLKNGGALGIFPEGTRNKTDAFLLPFKFGAVSFAKKTDAYIVPYGITGDYKIKNKNLTIRFGKPFKVTNMDLKTANKKLEKEVEKLMKMNIKKDN